MNLFNRKKYGTVPAVRNGAPFIAEGETPFIPDGLWIKCLRCKKAVYVKELSQYRICPHCGHYFRLSALDRIVITADMGTVKEINGHIGPANPLDFPGYPEKTEKLKQSLGIKEAVVTVLCRIEGIETVLCAMDSNFIMGSMGSAVGEKLARAFEYAEENLLPVIIFTASGGARMQEGILSLMQMAKVSAAVRAHSDKGLLYVSVLTDPTTGGVTASFAMLGDIILAEPKALVGFAGRRVIEQTMGQQLPEGFQTAEFVYEHGFVDKVVPRERMKAVLGNILRLHFLRAELPAVSGPQVYRPQKEKDPAAVVELARKVSRPTARQFINHLSEDFIELHGDRLFCDDKAVIGGVGLLNGCPVTFIGTQKGESLSENIERNFGQPHPEGYRKVLRLMRQAEKFGRPVVTLINTSGAYCGMEAEERGQGEAIARNLFYLSGIKVPVVSVIFGEGGSGGALALAASDRVFMLEYAVYSILSPEGFASILWKDSTRAKEAARMMKITAAELLRMGLIEGIIPEAAGGCQNDFKYTADYLKIKIHAELAGLLRQGQERLVEKRYERFRKFGEYTEETEPK